jgi:hypothetical protein
MNVDDTTPRFNNPPFMGFNASEEENVRVALEVNVLRILSRTIGAQQLPKERFERSSAIENIKGNPDFVFLAGDNFVLPIEVKKPWILPDDNIVEVLLAEGTAVCVADSIAQIFGYMAQNHRCYGVLSTYNKTWFLCRPVDMPGSLLISAS